MTPRQPPPVEYQFVKGRSGNPLGRPKMQREQELLLVSIKFFDLIAKAYYQKGDAMREVGKIKRKLSEK